MRLALPDITASHIAENHPDTVKVFKVLGEQPPGWVDKKLIAERTKDMGKDYNLETHSGYIPTHFYFYHEKDTYTIKLHYPIGSKLDLTETWRYWKKQVGTGIFGSDTVCGLCEYKADKGNLLESVIVYPIGTCPSDFIKHWWYDWDRKDWRSPVTMPSDAVRLHGEVIGNKVIEQEGKWGELVEVRIDYGNP